MPDISSLPLDELIKGFDCPHCGCRHETQLKVFRSGAGVIHDLPDVIRQLKVKKPLIVFDHNTKRVAGELAMEILKQAGIGFTSFTFAFDDVEPDEAAVGSLCMALDRSCDIILAVGSGVINDVCKVVAYAAGLPSMVIGTAPSMDGYASNSSSMHVNGVKSTLYNACPVAILCDTDIVSKAPERMLWSGLGDMMAKSVSILEWRISNRITDEPYCPTIAQIVRLSLKKCIERARNLADRDPLVIAAVFEGLTLSGVAMSFARSSRPASGIEHYFSHMWEMMAMERHAKADFHGIQVGVGTVLSLGLYDWARTLRPDRAKAQAAMASFNTDEWSENVRRIFGQTAEQVLAIEASVQKNDPARHARRLDRIVSHWDEILGFIAEELPDRNEMMALMRALGMPVTPSDLGISTEDVRDAFIGSRDIRDKYIFSSLMWDLGLTAEAAARLSAGAE